MLRRMNALLACKVCLWTGVANKGDLVITRTDADGRCTHEVKHL